jgi:hypothetical protein
MGTRGLLIAECRAVAGSNISERTFVCGDPSTVEWLFNAGRTPTVALYGGR